MNHRARTEYRHPKYGWVPPAERTSAQSRGHGSWIENLPRFADLNRGVDLPNFALNSLLALKVHKGNWLHNEPWLRVHQLSGSCVGAGGMQAQWDATIGDQAVRGDIESSVPGFWLATYGKGREIAGMGGRGEGSMGYAQAEAVHKWGFVRHDYPGVPQPNWNGRWMTFSGQTEIEWSWPARFPVKIPDDEAGKNQCLYMAKIRNTDEMAQAAAQGYGLTQASMFGTSPRVRDGILIGDWDDSWAHQMCDDGYATHPNFGRVWRVKNQWHEAHPPCPFFDGLVKQACTQLGVTANFDPDFGSFWVTDKTMQKIIDAGDEVFAIGNTEGFDARVIDWKSIIDKVVWA